MLILDKLWYIRKRTTHYSLILSETNKENFMKKKSFILMALLLALVFSGCPNADGDGDIPQSQTEDTSPPDIPDDPNEVLPVKPIMNVETSFSLASAVRGEQGALFTFPEEDGPWEVELVEGKGDFDNHYFEIEHYNEEREVESDVEGGVPITVTTYYAKLVIKETSLPLGFYSVRLRIKGAEYSVEKILVFEVVKTPAEFNQAPLVGCAMLSANKNKLEISWNRRTGAAGYKVYIGKTDSNAQAVLAETLTGMTATSAEIDHYPGDTNEDLPDRSTWYVWVKAFNDSGETKFSPVKSVTAGESLPEEIWGLWGSGLGIPGTGSEAYNLTLSALKLEYGIETDGVFTIPSSYAFDGTIKYHQSFGEETLLSTGSEIPGGQVTGKAGVIIIKFINRHYNGVDGDYYAVYYWGLGAAAPDTKTNGDPNPRAGKKLLHLGNAWDIRTGSAQTHPQRFVYTLEDAQNLFTKEMRNSLIGWNLVWPQYKME
jgi:hypothetical protein